MQTRTSSRIMRRVGVTMMVASLAIAGSLIGLAPAGAQATEGEPVPVEVVKSAYYTTNPGRGAPNTVTSEFPPGVVCIVRPQLCPEQAEPVTKPIGEALGAIEDLPNGPAEVTLSGTLPVGTQLGEPYYRSALLTTLPAVPAGQVVDRFVLQLDEDARQTFHTSSPIFRQAVQFALTSYQKQGFDQEEFMKVLAAAPLTQAVTGLEACPITEDFTDGEHQPEAAAPPVECLLGSNGLRLEDGTWEFDLSFAAEAWSDGSMPNLGILIRPAAAPNLAYGDKDLTSSARVVFLPATAAAVVTYREASSPAAPFVPAPAPADNSSGQQFTSSPQVDTGGMQPAPVFAPDAAPAAEPDVAPDAAEPAFEDVAAPIVPAAGTTAWWIWLLVPIFLGGMYLTAQSLTAEVVLASDRRGAMSRLLALSESD